MSVKFYTNVSVVPIDSIKPHPLNDKVHSPRKLVALAKAIKENNFDQPIVVNSITKTITKGHARYYASKEYLKLKTVPVVFKDYQNDDEQLLDLKLDNEVSEIDKQYDAEKTKQIINRVGKQISRALDEQVKEIRETVEKKGDLAKDILEKTILTQKPPTPIPAQSKDENKSRPVGGETKDQIQKSVKDIFSSVEENQDQKKQENKRHVIIIDCQSQESKEALKEKLRADILESFGAKIY